MTEAAFRRLLLRFSLFPILSICLFLVFLGALNRRINQRRADASLATNVLLQCDQLTQTLLDEETGIRGYLAANDRTFLQPYQAAAGREDQQLTHLSKLLAAGSDQATRVHSIGGRFRTFDATNRALLGSPTSGEPRQRLLKDQKLEMDTLRSELGILSSHELALRDSNRQQIEALYRILPLAALIGGAVLAGLLILHGIRFFRKIATAFRAQLNETEVQRESFRTTINSIGDAVIVCDREGRIKSLNPTAEQLTGWTRQLAVGKPLACVFNIINEHSRAAVESPVAKVLRTGHVVGLANHTLLIRQDGSEVAIDDSGAPVRNLFGDIDGVVLVFRDIEERRTAERKLALRTAELEALLLYSPAAFASFDGAHRFCRVNHAFAEMDGVAAEQHVGRELADVMPAYSSLIEPIISEVYEKRTAVQREISLVIQGHDRQWLICCYPITMENRETPFAVGAIVLDISENWKVRRSLLQSEKLAAVGRLAASIAHEMNNPLASVTNLLYLIAQDETLKGDTLEFVFLANLELARASRIATQTLRFAKRSTAPSRIDLKDLLDTVLLLFNGRITLKRIHVASTVSGSPPFVGHANEIMQILVNLIGNALDALPVDGSLTVVIRARQQSAVAGIRITIADSGTGIPFDARSKIWEPFFTTKEDTGTGLGLWLVDEMVRKYGGTIRMRSSQGFPYRGTTFSLFLPSV
jgi:PAS domain S-box-containing protein